MYSREPLGDMNSSVHEWVVKIGARGRSICKLSEQAKKNVRAVGIVQRRCRRLGHVVYVGGMGRKNIGYKKAKAWRRAWLAP